MYVCMYVCMYACMYVCMDGWMYVCMYVFKRCISYPSSITGLDQRIQQLGREPRRLPEDTWLSQHIQRSLEPLILPSGFQVQGLGFWFRV